MLKVKLQSNNAWRQAKRLLALLAMMAGVVLLLAGYDAGYSLVCDRLRYDGGICNLGNRWHVLAYVAVAGLLAWLFVFYGGAISRLLRKTKKIRVGNVEWELGNDKAGGATREALAVGSSLDDIDVDEVVEWATDGDAEALHQLGVLLFYGKKGIERDKRRAAQCWRHAARQGLAAAQHNLGWALYYGQGVEQDREEAVRWWRQAAERDLAKAQLEIGVACYEGEGVERDEKEAVRWWRWAANQGLAAAQNNLGRAYNEGRGVKKNASEAARWHRRAAEQGFAAAQTSLGLSYHLGRGVPQDDKEAVRWWRLAAEQEYAWAQNNLGWAYNNGRGVKQDKTEATRWYRLAAEQGLSGGSAEAQCDLGILYKGGKGVPHSHREAYIWFAIAQANGREDAAAKMDGLAQGWPAEEKRAVQAEVAQRYDDIRRREEKRLKDDLEMGLFLFEYKDGPDG